MSTLWKSITEHKDRKVDDAQREALSEDISLMFAAYPSEHSYLQYGSRDLWLDRLMALSDFHTARYALQIACKFYPHRLPNLGEVLHIAQMRALYGEFACTSAAIAWTSKYSHPDEDAIGEPFAVAMERLVRLLADHDTKEKTA